MKMANDRMSEADKDRTASFQAAGRWGEKKCDLACWRRDSIHAGAACDVLKVGYSGAWVGRGAQVVLLLCVALRRVLFVV